MKKEIIMSSILMISVHSYGQSSIQTKEIKIPYTNGYEVFQICSIDCSTTFDDKKEYYWYTEFSKIKSTKGGSGGSLLHGNYKFYDENGNLIQDKNYYLGLSDGSQKKWDSLGNIISQSKYSKGDIVYLKFQNDEKYWIELNGATFREGTFRKVYTPNNTLVSEETMLANFKQNIKTYYEFSGKLKEEYTSSGLGSDYLMGKYSSFYENGKIEVQGQFGDGEYMNIRVGTWKWYNPDGTLDVTENYKAEVVKWPNGKRKFAGGYILNTETNEWIKDGEWRWYDEDGKYKSIIKYSWGVETND